MVTLIRPRANLLVEQCQLVRDYADLRPDRGAEITSQLGFPTEYFAMILGLNQGQHANTFELIMATQVAAAHAAMIVKNVLAVRRPDQIDGRILPMIPTPGHGSFPSAHATESYAAMTVLEAVLQHWATLKDNAPRAAMLRGLAERIAVNRTVAGVHFPIDSWAGAALGTAVGRMILGRCGLAVPRPSLTYDPVNHDFNDYDFGLAAAGSGLTSGPDYGVTPSDLFTRLWGKVMTEAQTASGA